MAGFLTNASLAKSSVACATLQAIGSVDTGQDSFFEPDSSIDLYDKVMQL
jgi:hypothetical protein